MMHPIENFDVHGAIWYHGERNSMTAEEAFEHRRYFPLMIQSWRKLVRDPELPFLFVQRSKMSPRNTRELPTTEFRGQTIVVSSETVPKPVAVLYALKNDPQGILASDSGLPVSPFRSDSFDLVNAKVEK